MFSTMVPCAEAMRSFWPQASTADAYENINVFVDPENPIPTEAEKMTFYQLETLIDESATVLIDLMSYGNGASVLVKQAIQEPDNEPIQKECAAILYKNIEKTKTYHTLALKIKKAVLNLLNELASGPLDPADQLKSSTALCLQLARLIDIAQKIDCVKDKTPALLNDISFFRRIAAKNGNHYESLELIQLFFAQKLPTFGCIIEASQEFLLSNEDLNEATKLDIFVIFIYICAHMVDRKINTDRISRHAQDFFARVMTGAIVIFDHIDKKGTFCRTSLVDIKYIVEVLKTNIETSQHCLDFIKFNSKHFNDPITPKSIKLLF